jgi:hypothetical protein
LRQELLARRSRLKTRQVEHIGHHLQDIRMAVVTGQSVQGLGRSSVARVPAPAGGRVRILGSLTRGIARGDTFSDCRTWRGADCRLQWVGSEASRLRLEVAADTGRGYALSLWPTSRPSTCTPC